MSAFVSLKQTYKALLNQTYKADIFKPLYFDNFTPPLTQADPVPVGEAI